MPSKTVRMKDQFHIRWNLLMISKCVYSDGADFLGKVYVSMINAPFFVIAFKKNNWSQRVY